MSLSSGTRIGPYEVISIVGVGGMGEVYRARDTRLARDVALKILPSDFAQDADWVRRFEQEARSASALNHPNIVTVFDVGIAQVADGATDVRYIATELVPGRTLREVLNESETMPPQDAVRVGAAIAEGLAAAHKSGIVHRDLKSENIVVTPQRRVKILDFGLAKVTNGGGDNSQTRTVLSSAGLILGTVGYLSPEQVRGEPVDQRSDIFALGLLLHEMVSGQQTFARTAPETMTAILKDQPSSLPQSVSFGLRHVISRCLEKDPEQRFQNAQDVAFALIGSITEADAPPEGVRSSPRRIQARIAAAVLGVSLVVLGALAFSPFARNGKLENLGTITLTPFAVEPRAEGMPVWSPDGRSIAYYRSQPGGGTQLVVRPWSSPTATVIARDLGRAEPVFWAPDSSRVFFIDGRRRLKSVSTLGGAVREDIAGTSAADISPDGRTVAFWREQNERGESDPHCGLAL